MTKHMMLRALSEYMQAKGVDTVSLSDYKADENAPVRDYLLRRKFGSWNRVLAAAKHRFPIEVAPVVETPAPAPKKAKAKKED
tara:strand:+ start:274 stop:522 length:249 start_codon:yes stop_codon:yes gene_type:complete